LVPSHALLGRYPYGALMGFEGTYRYNVQEQGGAPLDLRGTEKDNPSEVEEAP
jgi:hypothetical protein